MGETASTDVGNDITVHSYEYVPPTDIWQPEPGFEYNAADIEACASPDLKGSADFNPFDFGLQMPDNTRLQPHVGVKEPALNLTTLPPGDCVRGYVTFQVPQGGTPAYVIFSARSTIIKWAVQGVEWEILQYEPEPTPEAEAPLPDATSDESPSLAPSEEEPSTEPTTEPAPQYETTPTPTDEPNGGGEVLEGTTAEDQYGGSVSQ